MEFTDLTRKIVAAAEGSGLRVWSEQLTTDAATLYWEFGFTAAPEDWKPPYKINARFEISFDASSVAQLLYDHTVVTGQDQDGDIIGTPMTEPMVTITLPNEVLRDEDVPALWEVLDAMVDCSSRIERRNVYSQKGWNQGSFQVNYHYMLETEEVILNIAVYESIFDELRATLNLLQLKYGVVQGHP